MQAEQDEKDANDGDDDLHGMSFTDLAESTPRKGVRRFKLSCFGAVQPLS